MKFRSKETIDAVQFNGRSDKPTVVALLERAGPDHDVKKCVMTRSGNIVIPGYVYFGDPVGEDRQIAKPTDWIVRHNVAYGSIEVVTHEDFCERYEFISSPEAPADQDLTIPQVQAPYAYGGDRPLDHPLGLEDPKPAPWGTIFAVAGLIGGLIIALVREFLR